MDAKTVVVVRHAGSMHHIKRMSGGWTDLPLTALGHEQACRVARRLQAELVDKAVDIYTSDLVRARETAEYIALAFGVEPVSDRRLREHNNGEAAGLHLDEVLRRWPEGPLPWAPDHRQYPGSETWREFQTRVDGFWVDVKNTRSTPILVTHAGTALMLVATWLGLAPEAVARIWISHDVTGVTVLTEASGLRRLDRLNDTSHLSNR